MPPAGYGPFRDDLRCGCSSLRSQLSDSLCRCLFQQSLHDTRTFAIGAWSIDESRCWPSIKANALVAQAYGDISGPLMEQTATLSRAHGVDSSVPLSTCAGFSSRTLARRLCIIFDSRVSDFWIVSSEIRQPSLRHAHTESATCMVFQNLLRLIMVHRDQHHWPAESPSHGACYSLQPTFWQLGLLSRALLHGAR